MFLHWIGFKRDLILLKDRLRRVANSVFFGSRSLIYSIYRDCQRNRTCAFRVRLRGSPTIYFALSQVAVSYVHLWCNVRAGSSDLKVRRRPSGECRQVNWLLYDLLVLCQHDEQKDWTLIKRTAGLTIYGTYIWRAQMSWILDREDMGASEAREWASRKPAKTAET